MGCLLPCLEAMVNKGLQPVMVLLVPGMDPTSISGSDGFISIEPRMATGFLNSSAPVGILFILSQVVQKVPAGLLRLACLFECGACRIHSLFKKPQLERRKTETPHGQLDHVPHLNLYLKISALQLDFQLGPLFAIGRSTSRNSSFAVAVP